MNGTDAIGTIVHFVGGQLDARAFEEHLYHAPEFERLLSPVPAPCHSRGGTTLFHHLIALDFGDVADLVEARDCLARFLESQGVQVSSSRQAHDDLRLLLAAQPRWLDADTAFVSSLLASAPPMSRLDRGAWLKRRILEVFRFAKLPPKWLQAPQWPMGKEAPMVFLGQIAVDEYFHDTASVYVFHDPATGEYRTLVQTM